MTEEAEIKLPEPWHKFTNWGGSQPTVIPLYTADQLRAAILAAKMEERERCAMSVEGLAQDVWDAAMRIQPPSDRAGQLAHLSQKLREHAAAIRKGE